jgi:hypothetical protein
MISLAYTMAYLLNGKASWFENGCESNDFAHIKQLKLQMTA